MSNKALTWALEQQTGSPTRKIVLLKLADQANDLGQCWPSKESIARHCELSRRTVQRLIHELEQAGFLSIQRRRDGVLNMTNLYRLPIQGGGDTVSPGVESHDLQGGVTRSPGVESQCLPEPSDRTLKEPQRVHRTVHFDQFWSEYPRKRNKKKAREVWARKRLDDKAETICEDVRERQKRDDQWRKGYIPHPTTYLNGERWEDEYATPQQQNESDEDRRTRELLQGG